MKNTNTVKTTSRFKRTVAASLAAVMMMTTAATISASADTQAAVSMNTNSAQTRIVREQYLGHDITPGSFTREGTKLRKDNFYKNNTSGNAKLCSLLSTYEGGSPKALDDLIFIAKNGLNGFSNLHELIFFFSNGLKIGNNHSFTQYLAWLESYDSWFEPTAVEYTVSGSTAPVALAA